MTLTPRQWLYLGVIIALLGAGWYFRDVWQDHKDVAGIKDQVQESEQNGEALDAAVADKIETEAAVDTGVSRVLDRNQETARHVPSYREYRDRPLPAESLRLYRDAAKAVEAGLGADRAGEGDDQKDH